MSEAQSKAQLDVLFPVGRVYWSRAEYSPCQQYRYVLNRMWERHDRKARPGTWRKVAFVGLNPSTATEYQDDPTVRRCAGFAYAWGYDGFIMLNLFAYRSTNPRGLYDVKDPVGPENDVWLVKKGTEADLVVACWGTHPLVGDRVGRVMRLAAWDWYCLALSRKREPNHPLYLPKDLKPQRWR